MIQNRLKHYKSKMKWKFNGKYDFFNSLTNTDSIAWPDKSWFYCEIRFFLIYAFFGLNFILQKFCPCKRNDKYQVCSRSVFNCKNHLVINDLTLLLILGQFRNLLISWTIFVCSELITLPLRKISLLKKNNKLGKREASL